MPDFEFFDVNVTLGRPSIPKYRVQTDAGAMKEDLARFGVTGGLVKHTLGEESHPNVGNERISADLRGHDRFEPVWTVMPHWTGEFPHPDMLLKDMRAAGVRALVAFPKRHGFPLRRSVTGELCAALEEFKCLLFLPDGEVSLAQVEEIAHDHPALPVVISNASHWIARELYPVLSKCPNVYVDTSAYMVHQGIEDICREFGAERLLFGTRYPLYNPGCAVAGLMYAAVSDDQKRLIAGANAERLLGEVRL